MKPELWQDEKIGDLSRDARLLLVGLVTMADDEGRLRGRPQAIIGHVFPWDDDVMPGKIKRWLGEIERQGVVLLYEVDGKPYIAFRHWRRHQKINRATASNLPAPPDPVVVRENAVDLTENPRSGTGESREPARSVHEPFTPPRAGARSGPVLDPAVVDQVLARLAECDRWKRPPESDRELVERTVLDTPAADHLAAATSAVAKGDDPKWRTRTPGKTFDYAVRQQMEYAAPVAEPEPGDDKSKYDRGLESRGAAA